MPVDRGDATWDLSGRLLIRTEGLVQGQQRAVEQELDPFVPGPPADAADLTLGPLGPVDLVEVHGPANDGTTTARDAEGRLLVRYGRHWVSVPAPAGTPATVLLEPQLAPASCWGDVVRPAMQQALRSRDAVAVHAAAVEDAGRAVLLSGWSESGKTEVALALVEAGAAFLTDKWTVVGTDGEVSAFPVGVGVRGWVLPALPQLRASLPRAARAQLTGARVARVATRPALEREGRGRLAALGASVVRRAVDLGDRAALSPTALIRAYGQDEDPARRAELATLVVLVSSPTDRVTVADAEPQWAARRLARTAAYERRRYYDLQERGAYAGLAGRAGARDTAVEQEHSLLLRALGSGVRVLRVDCPFPGDPRRVADAIATQL